MEGKVNVELGAVRIRHLKEVIKGFCEDYDCALSEISNGTYFDAESVAIRIIKAKENLKGVKDILYIIGLDYCWDGERVKLCDSITGKEYSEEPQEMNWVDKTIEEMDLTVRSYNCLQRMAINRLSDLIEYCESDVNGLNFLKVRNLGRKSLTEILDKLYIMTGKDFREQYGISSCIY